jgi:diguanylate cyclase
MSGTFNHWLVLLSLLVASFASYTALDLGTRITASKGRAARVWLVGGAFAMGTGIWSMHFIGMLAFSLPIPLGYDVPITLLSMLIAVVVSGFALYTVTRDNLGRSRLLTGAVLMGIGIAFMHYTGMAALRMSPPIEYDPLLFAVSVAIAIAASLAALWVAFSLRGDSGWMVYAKPVSALVMGLAITGMHYTGMAAAHFAAGSICLTADSFDDSVMAGVVAGITLVILLVTLLLSTFEARKSLTRLAASLQTANAELIRMTLHDPLTKLPNRLLLEDRIGQAIEECRRAGTFCAVVFVDLDRFKTVNDTLGHHAGDELLRTMAGRLRSMVRMEDTVSRISGDEFVVLLRRLSKTQDAAIVARKMIETLNAPVRVQKSDLRITASLGISLYPLHGDNPDALIINADLAMYHAKSCGRNDVQVFAPTMSPFSRHRLELQNDLGKALESEQLELHYQPKVDLKSGRITGAEALVRWRHPTRGLIAPNDFIPLAEDSGLIVPIGEWVMRQACIQNRLWQEQGLGKLRVAVNISAAQLRRGGLLHAVRGALSDSGLDPRYLELEITETVVMQNASEAIVMLETLSRMGVHLSVDDFGTGYSSFSYLKRLPLNTLKIDRSFVRDVSFDANDRAIVQAIVTLAHGLGLTVIAEGVENQAQLDYLRVVGSDQYQGYLRSRPVPAEAFARLLAEEALGDRHIESALAFNG